MNQNPSAPPPCRSVFREGAPAADQYTQLWISLINQMERSKKILAGSK